jgi:hypothetical protein
MAVDIEGPTGKKMTAIASAELSIGPSLLDKQMIELLELPPTGASHFQENQGRLVRIPLYHVTISFGELRVRTRMAPSDHGSPACILGGEFFQAAVGNNQRLIQDLVMPEHYRALRSVAHSKKRYALIAGKYGENRPRLERIKQALGSIGLRGVILDEHADIEEQSLAEKFVMYSTICRFVMIEDAAPAGHISELEICKERKFVTFFLRPCGKPSTLMQSDISDQVSYIKEFPYDDSDFEQVVIVAAKWADEAVKDRARKLNRKYSAWRSPQKIMR